MKTFTIHGYFTDDQAEAIKRKLQGKTFYHWQIGYSNMAGNCIINVKSNYDADVEELKKAFIWTALCELAR